MNNKFSHMDTQGNITMVDVGHKEKSLRIAKVGATIEMNANTLELLQQSALPKGDVLTTAKIAGILAAKQTANLIPLCHPLNLSYVDINFEICQSPPSIKLIAEVRTTEKTGVEMEALVAAQIAAATIYDMCKAVQKDIIIKDVRLLYKSGGKSGTFEAK